MENCQHKIPRYWKMEQGTLEIGKELRKYSRIQKLARSSGNILESRNSQGAHETFQRLEIDWELMKHETWD